MLVNIIASEAEALNGFTNVPLGYSASLDGTCEAGEATQFIASGVLDRAKPGDQFPLLKHWVSRLAPGGEIVITSTDLKEVARNLHLGFLSEADAVAALYGDTSARRAVLFTERSMTEALRSLGLQVTGRSVSRSQFTVRAVRPKN